MAYRSFLTDTWHDPWFESLSVQAKLLFVYLWTNPASNPPGIYELSVSRIKYESGVDFLKYYPEIQKKVTWFEEDNTVWVHNFFRYQCANPKFAHSACTTASKLPEKQSKLWFKYNIDKLSRYGIAPEKYGIDTVSDGYHTGTGTGTGTGAGTEQLQVQNKNTSCLEPVTAPASKPPVEDPVFCLIPLIKSEGNYEVRESEVQKLEARFDTLDVRKAIQCCAAWCDATPAKRKTRKGMMHAITTWCIRSLDRGQNLKSAATQQTPSAKRKPGPPEFPKGVRCKYCQVLYRLASQDGGCPECRERFYIRRRDGTYSERYPERIGDSEVSGMVNNLSDRLSVREDSG
jgi:hypothetical protein